MLLTRFNPDIALFFPSIDPQIISALNTLEYRHTIAFEGVVIDMSKNAPGVCDEDFFAHIRNLGAIPMVTCAVYDRLVDRHAKSGFSTTVRGRNGEQLPCSPFAIENKVLIPSIATHGAYEVRAVFGKNEIAIFYHSAEWENDGVSLFEDKIFLGKFAEIPESLPAFLHEMAAEVAVRAEACSVQLGLIPESSVALQLAEIARPRLRIAFMPDDQRVEV